MKVSNTEEKNIDKASTISFKELKKVSYLRINISLIVSNHLVG